MGDLSFGVLLSFTSHVVFLLGMASLTCLQFRNHLLIPCGKSVLRDHRTSESVGDVWLSRAACERGLLDLGNLGTVKACLKEANLHKDMYVGWVILPPVWNERSRIFGSGLLIVARDSRLLSRHETQLLITEPRSDQIKERGCCLFFLVSNYLLQTYW